MDNYRDTSHERQVEVRLRHLIIGQQILTGGAISQIKFSDYTQWKGQPTGKSSIYSKVDAPPKSRDIANRDRNTGLQDR